ncbi:hypothetical protein [Nonomuraea africana]|uniref:Uncharacterized protein n=1 Tax=Nonomuraea africana TaxID=46171 RepID=A0ABR9KUX2_9ACTN|nr:hypothetical protein [Nonomuraea africana]MBE1565829.1 hypothetical protein [Nonomuraea africana]
MAHNQGQEPYQPSYDAPTTPFQRVEVSSADQTMRVPKPPSAGPFRPPPAPPRRGMIARLIASLGDVPIKLVYLVAAVVATVLAVVLIFALFSGDQPDAVEPQLAEVSPPAAPAPSSTADELVLTPAPESLAFPVLPGKASKVVGKIEDKRTGLTYPKLGKPWSPKSFPPFVIAQRAGKVALPHTMIASAPLPIAADKPSSLADYRELAVRAARWSLRSQHPEGGTVTWTGSQKLAVGKGWIVGFRVDYTFGGKRQSSQALAAVVDSGKKKPAMLLATIPESGKGHWRDLNSLVKRLRSS